MGEAIARLCEAARLRRELCDSAYYCPEKGTPSELRFFLDGIAESFGRLNSGGSAADYIYELGEFFACPPEPDPDDDGVRGWLFSACLRDLSKLHALATAALREALSWGQLAPTIEGHIGRLLRAAEDAEQEVGACKVRWADAPEVREIKGGMLEDIIERMKRQPCIDHARYAAILERWFEAYGALSRFAGDSPPAAEQQTGGKPAKPRRRAGGGGRPAKFSIKFIREVVAARERDRKHARTSRRPLPPIPRWLSDYCTAKQIDIGKTFPQSVPGEAWSDRANRFWKAATKRLREAETNRH